MAQWPCVSLTGTLCFGHNSWQCPFQRQDSGLQKSDLAKATGQAGSRARLGSLESWPRDSQLSQATPRPLLSHAVSYPRPLSMSLLPGARATPETLTNRSNSSWTPPLGPRCSCGHRGHLACLAPESLLHLFLSLSYLGAPGRWGWEAPPTKLMGLGEQVNPSWGRKWGGYTPGWA